MTQLKKFIILMILLVSTYSISWSQSNSITSLTGGVEQTKIDSVLVPIEFIKIANAKMIELKYEKELNAEYENLLSTDSSIIDFLKWNLSVNEQEYNRNIKEIKKQRNIAIGAGSGASILLFVLLLFAI